MAPVKCYYHDCINTNATKSMFSFPINDESRLKLWIKHSGNATLASLTNQKLKRRFICEDHFDPQYVLKHHVKSTLTPQAVPLMYKAVAIHNEENNKWKSANSPEDYSKCNICSKTFSGFVFVCVQCNVRVCDACDEGGPHAKHYVLRAPSDGSQKQLNAVVRMVRAAVVSAGLAMQPEKPQTEFEVHLREDQEQEESEIVLKTEVKEEFEESEDPLGSEYDDPSAWDSTESATGSQVVPEQDTSKQEQPMITINSVRIETGASKTATRSDRPPVRQDSSDSEDSQPLATRRRSDSTTQNDANTERPKNVTTEDKTTALSIKTEEEDSSFELKTEIIEEFEESDDPLGSEYDELAARDSTDSATGSQVLPEQDASKQEQPMITINSGRIKMRASKTAERSNRQPVRQDSSGSEDSQPLAKRKRSDSTTQNDTNIEPPKNLTTEDNTTELSIRAEEKILVLFAVSRPPARPVTPSEMHLPAKNARPQRCKLCYAAKVRRTTVWRCGTCQVNLCIEGCYTAYHRK